MRGKARGWRQRGRHPRRAWRLRRLAGWRRRRVRLQRLVRGLWKHGQVRVRWDVGWGRRRADAPYCAGRVLVVSQSIAVIVQAIIAADLAHLLLPADAEGRGRDVCQQRPHHQPRAKRGLVPQRPCAVGYKAREESVVGAAVVDAAAVPGMHQDATTEAGRNVVVIRVTVAGPVHEPGWGWGPEVERAFSDLLFPDSSTDTECTAKGVLHVSTAEMRQCWLRNQKTVLSNAAQGFAAVAAATAVIPSRTHTSASPSSRTCN